MVLFYIFIRKYTVLKEILTTKIVNAIESRMVNNEKWFNWLINKYLSIITTSAHLRENVVGGHDNGGGVVGGVGGDGGHHALVLTDAQPEEQGWKHLGKSLVWRLILKIIWL